jgi:predicted nucleotidyltransferase
MIHDRKVNFNRIGERIERLKEIPQRIEGIELIVLFGSLAEGEPKPLSDVDVAFQVANLDSKKRTQIWGETTDALETDEVDIVYLNEDVPYHLKYEIAWNGRLLYEAREGLFSDFKVLSAAMWFDFKPYADYQTRRFWDRIKKVGFGK